MFVRKSGCHCPDHRKTSGKSALVKTVDSSSDSIQIPGMVETGKRFINEIKGQSGFHFDVHKEQQLVDLFFKIFLNYLTSNFG